MVYRFTAVLIVASGFLGCAHRPDTVVHFSAPSNGGSSSGWTVRDPRGTPMCTLPCSVELDEHEAVIVHHAAGKQFVVQQDSLGKGVWSGSIRATKEPSTGALVVQGLSSALVRTGATLIETRREDRVTAGIVLTSLGAAGVLASEAMPGKRREELWLEQIANR